MKVPDLLGFIIRVHFTDKSRIYTSRSDLALWLRVHACQIYLIKLKWYDIGRPNRHKAHSIHNMCPQHSYLKQKVSFSFIILFMGMFWIHLRFLKRTTRTWKLGCMVVSVIMLMVSVYYIRSPWQRRSVQLCSILFIHVNWNNLSSLWAPDYTNERDSKFGLAYDWECIYNMPLK